MPRTVTTAFRSLGERRLHQCRALLASLVLHGMLLLGLVGLMPRDHPTGRSAPSIVYADFVGDYSAAIGDLGRVPEAETQAPEPVPAERSAALGTFDPLPASSPTTAVATAPPAPPALGDWEPAAVAADSAAAMSATAARALADRLPLAATEPFLDPALLANERAEPAPDPSSMALSRAQRRMLDRKIWEWSARLGDELAEADTVASSWKHRGQQYDASFTRVRSGDGMGIEQVVVAVTTEQDGYRWATEMRFKRLAFSSFAQFVDRWDPRVQIHDDQIDGRFHSNTEILVSNSRGVKPAFLGKVTTADGVNTSDSTRPVRHSEIFLGGLETRVQRIPLPRRVFPDAPGPDAWAGRTRYFDADTRITFYADGSYGWAALGAPLPEQRGQLSSDPHRLVGKGTIDLHVHGTVNGKVLVYTPGDIVIEGDIAYAVDPEIDVTADDYLGLVADGRVVVAEPETTGPGDLTLQAAIYAKRRFEVSRHGADGPGTLRLYGSLAAGTLSATEPRFRTEIVFDERLEEKRPPDYPMTRRYEVSSWDGRWSADPAL